MTAGSHPGAPGAAGGVLPFGGGVYPVVSTPFDADDELDCEALAAEVDWLVGCGVDGVVLAMVSELLRLSEQERGRAARVLCDAAAGRVAVVVGVGAETTRAAVGFAVDAERAGASSVMAAPPISVVIPDPELLAHYAAIIDSVALPVVVQDASGYVGRPLPISLYRDLLGKANRMLAARVNEVYFMVAGIPMVVKGKGRSK